MSPRSSPAFTALALSLAGVVAAQISPASNRTHRAARIAGGAIAGIAIGCAVLALLFLLCLCLCLRRRRARGAGATGNGVGTVGSVGGFSPFGGRRQQQGNLGAQEAGYGAGPQGAWNNNNVNATGGQHYQPPPGAPPSAPQPGGFIQPPTDAHTRPY